MKFDWDSANIDHIARHHVTPEEAEQVIEGEPLDLSGVTRKGEPRTVHLGQTDAGRVLLVVITERNGVSRVVTARPAKRKERAFYSKYKALIHEQDTQDT